MSATPSTGLETFLTKASIAPTVVVPTAISKAKPASVTVASITGLTAGDVVKMMDTGFKELDGKYFIIGAPAASAFTLVGSDTAASTGTLLSTPKANVNKKTDMVKMCLATVDPAAEAPGTTAVGTFCDPSASIPAITQAGTLTMTGYVELQAYYEELNLAVDDGKERILNVILPQGMGNIIAPAIISTIGWTLPLDGGIGFTASGAMTSKPKHRF